MIASEFLTLIVQPTTLCNLDCGYCYLPDRKRQRLMSAGVAARIATSIEEQASSSAVDVVWHGGEPLATPIAHMRSLLHLFEPLRHAGMVRHAVQTNATQINAAWCELLAEYEFQVGVSIDGPASCNDARVDLSGRPAFARIMKGIDQLRYAGVPYTAICVVTPETIDRADDLVAFFTELGCTSVGFNLEEQEGLNAHRESITKEQAEAFWLKLWQLREAGSDLGVRDLDRLCDHLTSDSVPLPTDPIPTVSHDGNVVILSPELLGVASAIYGDFVIGNVRHESIPAMLARAKEVRYVREFMQALTACQTTCEFFDFCRGAQAGNRFFEHGTFAVAETAHCRNSRQALIGAALTHLAERR